MDMNPHEGTPQGHGEPTGPVVGAYDASAIRVLKEEEAAELFEWVQVGILAQRYRTVALPHIARLAEAARTVGEPMSRVVARYLDGDRSVEVSPEFREAFAELADQRRR